LTHETNLRVRYAETDQMGIVHHSHYAVWFEVGRTEFTKKVGIPYSDIEERGARMPLIHLSCHFKSPAHYEDEVVVRTYLKNVTQTRMCFGYTVIHKDDGRLLCEGESQHVWTDQNLKPINLQKRLPDVFSLYKQSEA
jgi:acyl-CoA thioester hydrolase